MITSFGNEESESEESEKEEEQKKPPPMPRKSALKAPKPAEAPSLVAGPALPPVHYGPSNRESLSDRLAQVNVNSRLLSKKCNTLDLMLIFFVNFPQSVAKDTRKSPAMSSNEEDILTRLKNQAKLLQKHNTKSESESSRSKNKDGRHKDLNMSLVPGYDDDSEGEEETRKSTAVKPLFPIAEASNSNSNSGKIAKNIETTTGKIRIYEYKNNESSNDASEKNEEESKVVEPTGEKPEEEKMDLETKANKFLENIDAPSKAFQRKKRIAFDGK